MAGWINALKEALGMNTLGTKWPNVYGAAQSRITKTPIQYYDRYDPNEMGAFEPDKNLISINKQRLGPQETDISGLLPGVKRTLRHEDTHAVLNELRQSEINDLIENSLRGEVPRFRNWYHSVTTPGKESIPEEFLARLIAKQNTQPTFAPSSVLVNAFLNELMSNNKKSLAKKLQQIYELK